MYCRVNPSLRDKREEGRCLMALTVKGSWLRVHGSKIQNSLHAYMILLKLPMNKRIDAFASLHKAYIKPT